MMKSSVDSLLKYYKREQMDADVKSSLSLFPSSILHSPCWSPFLILFTSWPRPGSESQKTSIFSLNSTISRQTDGLNSTISRLWGPNNVKVLKWLNSSRLFGLKWLNSSRFCSFWFWLWPDAYNLMNLQTYQRFSFAKCLPRSMIYYVWSSSFAQWKSRLSNILFLTPLIFICQAI